MRLRFSSGSSTPFQDVEEPLGRVHAAKAGAESLRHDLGYGLHLTLPQESVVDEDADQPVADGAVYEGGGHRRVHAAAQAAQHPGVAHLPANLLHRGGGEMLHVPIGGAPADAEQEILQHGPAVLGVDHLGMKLEAVETPSAVGKGGDGGVAGMRDHRPVLGQRRHPVAVAHPHALAGARVEAGEEIRGVVDGEVGETVLALRGFGHAAPHGLVDDAHAVADAQKGHG